MLNYNEMSKEMLIAHIQTMDMQLNSYAKAGAEKKYQIAELERQLQDHSAQAFSVGETYANALSRIAELESKLQEQDAMLGRRPCLHNRCMDMVSAQSRIAELEAQVSAASAPVVEQKPEWEDFDIEKTGDDHYDAGNFLLNAAKEFWSACHKAMQYGAVQWLLGENGELLIFTRGEYKNVLLSNIEMSGPTKHFKEPQATNKLREALLSVIPEKMAEKHGREFFQGEGQDEHRAEIKGWNDCRDYVCKNADKAFQASTALQEPVREVPEGWKLVPKVPTKEMIAKACSDHGYPGGSRKVYELGYVSMLAAAPLPAAPVQQEGE